MSNRTCVMADSRSPAATKRLRLRGKLGLALVQATGAVSSSLVRLVGRLVARKYASLVPGAAIGRRYRPRP